ncbi:hypothetical protein H0H92_010724, partial [Tricholoma furcatifolium]
PTDPLEDLPVGALIHALQVVEHSLNEYRTGTQIIDKTPQGFYSADNYGDKELEKKDENGRMFIEKTLNASRYIATFKDFKVKHWKAILDASREHLLNLPTRRGRKSRSSSQSSSVRSLRVEEEEDFAFKSDTSDEEARARAVALRQSDMDESSESDSDDSSTSTSGSGGGGSGSNSDSDSN